MAQIDRRTVLRGAGVTMCLPWLDSLTAFAAAPPGSALLVGRIELRQTGSADWAA